MTNKSDSDRFLNITSFHATALKTTHTVFPDQAQFEFNFWLKSLKSQKAIIHTVQTCKNVLLQPFGHWSFIVHTNFKNYKHGLK